MTDPFWMHHVSLWADPHDDASNPRWTAPAEPDIDSVWYRGWECYRNPEALFWTRDAWRAYKGGCDLGAKELTASTYASILDKIDAEED